VTRCACALLPQVRDLTIRAFAYGHKPAGMRVKDVMTRDAIPCFAGDTNGELGCRMQRYQVRGWPLVNHKQRLVGNVNLRGLI